MTSRLGEDRGAIAMMVGLLMVVLMGFAAISIDVGRLYAEKRQLQNGADAAALAVAQGGCTSYPGAQSVAQNIAPKNVNDGVATVAPVRFGSAGAVEVTVKTTVSNILAPVLGINTTDVAARSRAVCTAISQGPAKLPLAISVCAFRAYTDDDDFPTRKQDQSIEREVPNATTPDGEGDHRYDSADGGICPRGVNNAAQDFVWLAHDSGKCRATVTVSREYRAEKDDRALANCTSADFAEYKTKNLILPIFDRQKDFKYRILGFASFKLTGYYFSSTDFWGDISGCRKTQPCIRGHFLKVTDVPAEYTVSPTAKGLGATRPTLQYIP